MELSISDWNDITTYLNGYVLDRVYFSDNALMGVNSKGSEIVLANRLNPNLAWWQSVPGKACEAVDLILDEARIQVKESGDYSSKNKEKLICFNMEQAIKLYSRQYGK